MTSYADGHDHPDNHEPTGDHHDEPVILREFVQNEILFTFDSRFADRATVIKAAQAQTEEILSQFNTRGIFEGFSVGIPRSSTYVIERQNRDPESSIPRFFSMVKVKLIPRGESVSTQDTDNDILLYQHIHQIVDSLLKDNRFPFLEIEEGEAEEEQEEKIPRLRWNFERDSSLDIGLRAVSPNWLTGAATHAGGHSITGGPGKSVTILANPAHGGAALNITDLDYQVLLDGTNDLTQQTGTRPARVFILDSGIDFATQQQLKAIGGQNSLAAGLRPVLNDSTAAIAASSLSQMNAGEIPFITKLGAALSSINAAGQAYGVCNHNLGDLSQHGLFVAGIIHTLAPTAEIFLLSALNENGVGTTESIIACLEEATRFNDGTPTVINTSFSLVVAAETGHQASRATRLITCGVPAANVNAMTSQTADTTSLQQTLMRDWLHSLSSGLNPLNTAMISASGNDSNFVQNQNPRLQPRYPARYNDVIGVAASEPSGTPAVYSNKADQSTTATPATFGTFHTKAVTSGFLTLGEMRGLYLGKNAQGNFVSSLATWAGTSFASAVASGVLAALLTGDRLPAGSPGFANIEAALSFMENKGLSIAGAGGYSLPVTQL